MKHEVVYDICCLADPQTGEMFYQVWSSNPATGYQWLVREYRTTEEARAEAKRLRELEQKVQA